MPELRSTRIILCPFSGKGHLNPAMILAEKLALLGFSVTVVFVKRYDLSLISLDAIEGLDIELHMLEVEEDPGTDSKPTAIPGVKRYRQHLPERVSSPWPDYSRQQKKFESYLQELIETGSQPAAVILDWVVSWAQATAMKLSIPNYVLYTSSVGNLAASLYLREYESWTEVPEELSVPGVPLIRKADIFFCHSAFDPSHRLYDVMKEWESTMLNARAILLNSCDQLEGKAIRALRNGEIPLAKSFADRMFTVGPLLPASYFNPEKSLEDITMATVMPSREQSACQEWLDQQPPQSVLFISFGSWVRLFDEQILELATGLTAAKVRFLWVIPVPADISDKDEYLHKVLPAGFLDETRSTGLVVTGWAPQHLILAHPAVGAFFSHCGWNSTMESVTLAGVPTVAWPFLADQPFNSRLLVEGLGIGVEVVDNAEGIVERGEVERAVRLVMEGDEANAMRGRATKLKKAMQQTSSSVKDLEAFAKLVKSAS